MTAPGTATDQANVEPRRRRILHVDKFLHRQGGAPVYMMSLAALQRSHGDTVDFFSMADDRNEPATYAEHFASHIELSPFPTELSARAGTLARMIWSPETRRRFDRVLGLFRPDVVHVHNIYHQLSPSILWAAHRRDIPIVMTVHDAKLVCPSYGLYDGESYCDRCVGHSFVHAPLQRCRGGSFSASTAVAIESSIHRLGRLYRPVDRFICPSNFLADQLRTAGVFPDRIRVVPHFVLPNRSAALPAQRSGVLFAGRLDRSKGLATLIAAAGRHRELLIDVLGDGPDRAEFERAADDLAPGRVRFHGMVSGQAVADAMASAAVVALPSLVPENLSLTVIEAFAAGTPVVATALGGTVDLIDHGITGFLVPPGDGTVLGEHLSRLVEQVSLAREMGERARERATSRHGPATHIGAITAVYDEAEGRRREP